MALEAKEKGQDDKTRVTRNVVILTVLSLAWIFLLIWIFRYRITFNWNVSVNQSTPSFISAVC